MPKHDTPLLDELEKGPWPSFVTDLKRQAATKPECFDILGKFFIAHFQKIIDFHFFTSIKN